MRRERFPFLSGGLGVELCLPTVVLRSPPFASLALIPFLWAVCTKCFREVTHRVAFYVAVDAFC